jgi:ubiquinone/menaquinone biosynthesis C-methylase UbiE
MFIFILLFGSYYRDCIIDNIEFDNKVMVVGAGSSNMPEDLVNEGYTDVVVNDISRVAMKMQQVRLKHLSENITYQTGNMTDMDMPDGTIDAIIDKALLDSLYCSAMGDTVVAQYIQEVMRLLCNTGCFIIISYMPPEDALPLLEQFDIDEPHYTPWLIEVQGVVKPAAHEAEEIDPDDPAHLYWVYIATKNEMMVALKKKKEDKNLLKAKKATRKKAMVKAPNL